MTTAKLEEDFSAEEQEFLAVTDFERDDDYSRGNVVLLSTAYGLTFTTSVTQLLLASGNYFIEEIDLIVAYTGFPGMIVKITDSNGNIYLFYETPSGPAVPANYAVNVPLVVSPQALIPRANSLSLQVQSVASGSTYFIAAVNIYGRIVP